MATLPECFKKAKQNVEPQRQEPGDDARNAQAAHAEVRKVLRADPKLKQWGIDPILIGSYARRVSIRRIKDVDVFGRLTSPPESLLPGEALDEFERVLCAEYEDRCKPQHRSFKVDFPDFDLSVDAVPARAFDDIWQIPDRPNVRASWRATDPIGLTKLTEEMNGDERFQLGDNGVYVPMVKLLRQTRRAVLGPDANPGGLYFELLTYWVFKEAMTSKASNAEYFAATVRGVADLLADAAEDGLRDPTIEGEIISTKATKGELKDAAAKMSAAADTAEAALVEEDDCKSAKLWAEVLGDNCDGPVFEPPAYCNADGSWRSEITSAALLTRGSNRPPAGNDRFA